MFDTNLWLYFNEEKRFYFILTVRLFPSKGLVTALAKCLIRIDEAKSDSNFDYRYPSDIKTISKK